jgi:hypothetical protein
MVPAGVQEDERELLYDYYIQKVSGRLRQLTSPSENDKKRWIWELLQNAKDSIAKTARKNVDVEIEIFADRVIFKHNGEPFNPKALNSLIWQKSGDKRGDKESSGRFGTGFLTTHTLSQTVFLESNLIDKNNKKWGVKLTLYREGDSDNELREGIEKTLNSRIYSESVLNEWTSFTYILKSQINRDCAVAGIKSLKTNIYYNLAFTPEINSVKLTIDGVTTDISRSGIITTGKKINIQEFTVITGGVSATKSIAMVSVDRPSRILSEKFRQDRSLQISAAVEVNRITRQILPKSIDTPSLFCLFPLIGCEEFHYPLVVNSVDFEPIAERERLLLDGEEYNEHNIITNTGINRMILKISLAIYSRLLTYFSSGNWIDLYHLAVGAAKMPEQTRDFDKIWYKDNIQLKLRAMILAVPIVETLAGLKLIADSANNSRIYFPKSDSLATQKNIWQKAFDFMGDAMPLEDHCREWAKLAWEEDCSFLTLEVLAAKVSAYGNLNALPPKITDKATWIEEILELVQVGDPDLFDQVALIPNQEGDFQRRTLENFSVNDGVPIDYIRLLLLFGVNWNQILVHEKIAKSPILAKKNIQDFILTLNATIKQKIQEDDEELLPSILSLTSFIPLYSVTPDLVFLNKRTTLYDMSRAIFGSLVPMPQHIQDPDCGIWDLADIYLTKKIIKEIEKFNLPVVSDEGTGDDLRPIERMRKHFALNLNEPESDKFVLDWLNSLYQFLDENKLSAGNTVPNQNGRFSALDSLFQDKGIHNDLKDILFLLSPASDYRNELILPGLNIKPVHTKTTKDIADAIENFVKNADRENASGDFREAIRLLVIEWFNSPKYSDEIYFEHRNNPHQTISRALFEYCYTRRESLEINLLWTVQERKDFQILRKLLPDETRKMLLEQPDLLAKHEELKKENQALALKLEEAKVIFDKYPEITVERIDRLIELEALSQGWDTTVVYQPDQYQIRLNFENGWKGEAFVCKELQNAGFQVSWPNKSNTPNQNAIVDYEGEIHYIADQGHKYDLIVELPENNRAYIQVKTTVTDIENADNIALPISTREWKFIGETDSNERFYLARVFNINNAPELYLMKLNSLKDLSPAEIEI